ncbi:hypothetical protein CLOM_g13850 [Closterium sp. NIES-68]|nr:hypothetical protein CLOM_g13850 [Closterium sp. NIES-68]
MESPRSRRVLSRAESFVSFFRRLASNLTFSWVNPLVALGAQRQLSPRDLLPLPPDVEPQVCGQLLWSRWEEERAAGDDAMRGFRSEGETSSASGEPSRSDHLGGLADSALDGPSRATQRGPPSLLRCLVAIFGAEYIMVGGIKAMQELLDHMASVRAMAMEGAVLKRVNAARRQELCASTWTRGVYFWACTPVLFSLSTFSSLLLIGRSLNAPVVFTSLALFNVLLGPLNSFPWVINGIVEALISVHRLEAFLCIPTTPTASFASAFTSSSSLTPHTSSSSPTPSPTTAPDPSSSSKAPRSSLLHALFPERDGQAAGCEMDGEAQSMAFDAVQPSPPLAVHVCGLSFSWHAPTSAGSQGLDQMTGASAADDGLAVDGRAGSCSTRGEDSRSTRGSSRGSSRGSQHSIALHNIWLDVPEGAVVAIVGKVGSGKSSLLAAILGEMQPVTVHAMPCTHTHGAGHGKACAHGTYRSPRSAAVLQAVQRSSLVVVMQQGRIVHVAPPGVHVAPSNSVEEIGAFSSDLYTVDDSLPFIANILLANAFSLTGIAWSFLLLLLPLAYIYSIIQRLYRQSSRELRRLDSTARSPVSTPCGAQRGSWRAASRRPFPRWRPPSGSPVTGIITGRSLPKLFLPGNTAHQALPLSPPADSHLPIPAPHLLVPGGNTSPAFSFAPDPASANITPCFSNSAHPLLPALQSFSLPALPSIPHHLSSPQSSAGSSFSLSLATWLALRPGNRSGAWAGMCSAADTSDRARGLLQELSSMPVISSIIALLRRLFSLSLFSPIRLFGSAMTTAVSSGLLGLALAYTLPIVSLLNGTLTSLADTEKDMVAVERVQEYLDLQHEPDTLAPRPLTAAREEEGKGGGDAGHAEGPGEGAAEVEGEEWPREGSVEFQHVGIAGRTGAGKSSLLAALFRLRPLTPPSTTVTKATSSSSTSGTSTTTQPRHSSSASGIFIDGVDTARVSLSALRTALAIIPQTPLIFHAPIRDNLDPEGKHADVALWEAVRKCHLEAAVGRLGGLDAMVGGAAGRLSLGERQLLCLARVMLRKSKVLCLDECTANIDGATSALMHATIAREFHGITTITIAHRVSSLLSLPRVLIFEAGALAEDGDPKNLLVNPDSRFSSLFRASI